MYHYNADSIYRAGEIASRRLGRVCIAVQEAMIVREIS